jgi:hypothetical protein
MSGIEPQSGKHPSPSFSTKSRTAFAIIQKGLLWTNMETDTSDCGLLGGDMV